MSALPCGLDTPTIQWRDPAGTNPRGRLAGDVKRHPAGGLEAVTDADGQGLAIALTGSPARRDWDQAVPVSEMPLARGGDGRLWAPPRARTEIEWATELMRAVAAPSGNAGDVVRLTADLSVTLVNPSAGWRMLVLPTLTVRGAKLVNPKGLVSYDVVVGGQTDDRWPLFTCQPDATYAVIPTNGVAAAQQAAGGTTTTDATVPVVNSIQAFDVKNPRTEHYSGSVRLPTIDLGRSASTTVTCYVAIAYYADDTPAFDTTIGEMRLELFGVSIPDPAFGAVA